jgi:hypothetical protein
MNIYLIVIFKSTENEKNKRAIRTFLITHIFKQINMNPEDVKSKFILN